MIWELFRVELMERFSHIGKMYLFEDRIKKENVFEIQTSRRIF